MVRLGYAAILGTAAMVLATPTLAQDDTRDNRFSGFYVGASGGYDIQRNDVGESILFDRNLDGQFGDSVTTAAGANAFSPGFCNGRARTTANVNCQNDRDGWAYNGKAGFDIQRGNIVVGALGEFGHTEINDSVSAFSTTPAFYTMRRTVHWEGAARLRAGYVAGDSTLFYGTGGLGYARITRQFYTSNTANAYELRGDRKQLGFQAGGGIEQMLGNNFSVGLEYLFHQYKDNDFRVRAVRGTAPATNPFVLAPNTTGTDFRRSDENFRWHSLRATAAFRF